MTPAAYLTSEQAAVYLGFTTPDGAPNREAFRKFVARHNPRRYYLGRLMRFRLVDLDAALEVLPSSGTARKRGGAR